MSLLTQASIVITPSAYKEGKLYSVIPSDGSGDMSVTRATTATRVNSAGLVELVPYNLFNYSQKFDNAYWTKYLTTITADATTAPNGTTTADLFTSTGNGGYTYSSFTAVSSGAYTLSIYAKKGNTNFVALTFSNGIATDCTAWYNINTNTLGSTSGSITITNRTIEDAGNGWSRLTLTISLASAGSFIFLPQFVLSDNAGTATGNTGYAWGAQLVEGSSAKDYQKTETRLNIPRLDYSNGTCPSLLVEPQRTNIATNSENFATYTTFQASVTSNDTTAPNGLQTADKITTTGSGSGSVYIPSVSLATGSNTASCYFKAGNSNIVAIDSNGSGGYWGAAFNLSNQTYTIFGITSSASIEEVGNGWYRCSVTASTSSTAYLAFGVIGNTGSTAYAWGAQLEAGSYATSYIPTTSASVTRNADVISKTGISSLIGQTEGVLFCDIDLDADGSAFRVLVNLLGATSSEYITINSYNTTGYIYADISNTTNQALIVSSINSGRCRVALAYKNNDIALYINGTLIGTDTSATIPATSAIALNYLTSLGVERMNNIYSIALWKTRLTNDQLTALTTI
jgi:hypothetical protein